jgi:NAD(P)-dependent dehydrogenase (short-subunit alcohol dehydrogenase family)
MTDHSGQTVLTTGANSGLGLATSLHLSRLRFRSIGVVRSKATAGVVTQAAKQADVSMETVDLDVTDAERCRVINREAASIGGSQQRWLFGVGAIEDISDDKARHQL